MVGLVQDKVTLSAAPVAEPAIWLRLCGPVARALMPAGQSQRNGQALSPDKVIHELIPVVRTLTSALSSLLFRNKRLITQQMPRASLIRAMPARTRAASPES